MLYTFANVEIIHL